MNRIRSTIRAKRLQFILVALFLLVTWPVWRWLWGEWWGNDYYSHGLLIVPISLYLGWRILKHHHYQWLSQRGENQGLALLMLSLAAYLFFLVNSAFYLAAFAVIGLIGGLLWTFGGRYLLQLLLFPLGFLLLMVPLPFLERTTLPLALLTGFCSGTVVRWLGLDVLIVGQAVTLPNTELLIGAQCSGINSIISLFTLTILGTYVLKGPWWGKLSLVAVSIPLAMLGNILRVATLLFVARRFGANAAFIFYHDYSGVVAFVLILLLLIPISKTLQCTAVRYELV